MARVTLEESYLTNIANAIRTKTGLTITYKPFEMPDAILSISGSGGITPTGTINITSNGIHDVTRYASANVQVSSTINNQNKTITPTTSQQTVTADSGYTGLGTVTINAMPSGSAGTPSASKGTVSNHSISITPSVTNTTGYIVGSTKTGTAVTVSASELVSGNKSITSNGTNIDVINYATVSVNVSGGGTTINNQDKSVTPSESEQTITADNGYTGLGTVTVGAISSTYVGSGITQRTSSSLSASGATVTAPAGYYASQATKTVSTLTLPTTTSSTSSGTSKASFTLTAGTKYLNIPTGYNSAAAYYTLTVASGSATGPSTVSSTGASVSTGTNTLTLTKTGVSTTPTVSAGYVASATSSTGTVTLTASVTTKAAATITPGTSNQTIAAGTYLTGTQTIIGDADLVGSNILSTANIFGVQGTVALTTVYVSSSSPSSSTGSNGDIYIQS